MPESKLLNQQPFNECPDFYNEQDMIPQMNAERRRSGDLEGNAPKENRFPFGQKPFAYHDIPKNEYNQNMNNNNQKYDNNANYNNNNNNNNPNNNMYMNPNNNPQYNNYDHYGKNQQVNPEYQDDPFQNYNDPRNFNNFNRNKEYKDPDVWDPAPPAKSKKQGKNVSKPKATPVSNPNKPNQKVSPATNQAVANKNNQPPNANDK